jgi:hypothetical protein
MDFPADPRCESVIGNIEIVVHLEPQPETGGVAEEPGQSQSGVGRDSALAMDDLVNPAWGNPKRSAKPVLADAQRREELFLQNLARMHRRNLLHMSPLVIMYNLDVMCAAVAPHETDPPLIIDPYTVLTLSAAGRASSRFPGGTRRSSTIELRLSMRNFRKAVF